MVHFTSSVSIGVAQVRAESPALTASQPTSRYFAGPRKLGAWSGSRVFPQRQQGVCTTAAPRTRRTNRG